MPNSPLKPEPSPTGMATRHDAPVCILCLHQTLLALIQELQRHRGMSAALIGGDHSFRQALDRKSLDVDHRLLTFCQQIDAARSRQPGLPEAEEISAFAENWADLQRSQHSQPAELSFARHTALIGRLLHWLSTTLTQHPAMHFHSPLQRRLIDNIALRLPALSELLGQSRALGAWVAARGGCSPLIRVRLIFLLSRAESLLSEARPGEHNEPGGRIAKQTIHSVASIIRSDMLANSGINIPPPRYFDLVSRAIDDVFIWIEHSITGLEKSRQAA